MRSVSSISSSSRGRRGKVAVSLSAEIHAMVRAWRCLNCNGALREHEQWFWCSARCRQASLDREASKAKSRLKRG